MNAMIQVLPASLTLKHLLTGVISLFVLSIPILSYSAAPDVIRTHAIAMHGEPKYPSNFQHFDYVNPDAPKGGFQRQGAIGSFDSFNAWIDKGQASGTGSTESLMARSEDEAFTLYCLICESIEYPQDRAWVIFHLREQARWHDGRTISADDVVWTFNALIEHGTPSYRFYYAEVEKVEKLGPLSVRFQFKSNKNREMPLIVGELPVLPKHYWVERDFTKTTLEPPIGSGPYRVKRFEAGRFIEQERVTDYWGRDLPVRKGLFNIEILRYDYFRDRIPIRLALKSGELDYYLENTAKSWASEFELASIDRGWLVKERLAHRAPQGMQAFVLNVRRDKYKDSRVREAIALAFDFEWTNKNIFYDQYTRSSSYFSNSDLASSGVPDGEELALLEPYRDQLPARLFSEPFSVPVTDGKGWSRENLLKALELLKQAGWRVANNRLINEDGETLNIEMLLYSSSFERIALPYASNLKRLGIDLKIRVVDTGQYINRVRAFDFDMIVGGWGQTESPGNEQREFWSCAAAKRAGSRNSVGICSAVIDKLVEQLINAESRESLITLAHALDRVLLWGHYIVPNWHLSADRILWWNQYSRPDIPLRNGVNPARWWFDKVKYQQLETARQRGEITKPAEQPEQDSKKTPSGWRMWLLIIILLVGSWVIYKSTRSKKINREN